MMIKFLTLDSAANTERGHFFVFLSFEYSEYHRIWRLVHLPSPQSGRDFVVLDCYIEACYCSRGVF